MGLSGHTASGEAQFGQIASIRVVVRGSFQAVAVRLFIVGLLSHMSAMMVVACPVTVMPMPMQMPDMGTGMHVPHPGTVSMCMPERADVQLRQTR
ncbi:MAG: hypothetical protein RLZZ436_708 [Planctomycetota bacterium]